MNGPEINASDALVPQALLEFGISYYCFVTS